LISPLLPDGVILRNLIENDDDRGTLLELYREPWVPVDAFQQWNLVQSRTNVLRGVHVHPRHCDYLHVINGEMLLGLHDLRPEDPNARTTCFVTMKGETPCAAFIPPGICHGFWFPMPTTYVYGLSSGWSINEELGCRYDDKSLGLDWPSEGPILSPRDAAPSADYEAMRAAWFAQSSGAAT